jgi:hypothetical protein
MPWRPRRGVELQLYSFFNLLLDGCGWSTPGQAALAHCTRRCVGPKLCRDGCEKFHSRRGFPPPRIGLYSVCTSAGVVSLSWLSCILYFLTTHNTNLPASGEIRTCNPSQRSAADPRLRQLGYWDRRIQSPDRPARGEWLYRLSYRGPWEISLCFINIHIYN